MNSSVFSFIWHTASDTPLENSLMSVQRKTNKTAQLHHSLFVWCSLLITFSSFPSIHSYIHINRFSASIAPLNLTFPQSSMNGLLVDKLLESIIRGRWQLLFTIFLYFLSVGWFSFQCPDLLQCHKCFEMNREWLGIDKNMWTLSCF